MRSLFDVGPVRNPHNSVYDLYLKALDPRKVSQGEAAGSQIEAPAVPGTGDGSILQPPVGERAALMRAAILQRKKLAAGVKDRDFPSADRNDPARTGRNIARPRDSREV